MELNAVERAVNAGIDAKSRINRKGQARLFFVKSHKPQPPYHVKVSRGGGGGWSGGQLGYLINFQLTSTRLRVSLRPSVKGPSSGSRCP